MSVMLANAGTPLMWATAFHLFIGNALIGMAEGAMLCALFRFKRTTAGIVAIGLMVAANYASAWAGVFVFGNAARRFELDISNVPYFLLCAVAAAFLLSILLEFPFVLAAMWKEQRRIRKAIVGTLAVQVVSYAVLMLWYGSASSTSLITQTQSVPPAALSPPDNIVLFHIAADDGDVYRGTLLEPRQQKVYDADAMNPVDRVVARPSKNDPERWELCALRFRSGIREVEVIVIDA